MSVAHRPLTYDDLFAMPDDGKRRELIGGELFVNPAPRRDHQAVASNLIWILQQFLHESGSGQAYMHPVDLYVGPNDVVQPDLIVIRQSRLEIYQPEGMVIEPPDIVVEIISPSSQRTDRKGKLALYERFGVPEYWIVDPEIRMVVLNSLDRGVYLEIEPDDDDTLASRAFPGLRINPADVFSSLDSEDSSSEGSS